MLCCIFNLEANRSKGMPVLLELSETLILLLDGYLKGSAAAARCL